MANKEPVKARKPRLTKKAEKFADAMANPDVESNAAAAIEAGYEPNSASVTASVLLKNPNVQDRIEKRKAEVAKHANITDAQVIGATALRAFATIDDAFDERGYFDITKARETGAIHLIKKIHRTHTKYGENIAVEFYSNESAQDRLGAYLGLEKQPGDNPANIQRALTAFNIWFEKNPEASPLQVQDAISTFAHGLKVDEQALTQKVTEIQQIETTQ
jgi:phage terminase small subunit